MTDPIDWPAILPPFDETVERALLSEALLFGPVNTIESKHFFLDAHRCIYDAIQSVHAQPHPQERPLVGAVRWLRRAGMLARVGGSVAVLELLELPDPLEYVIDRAGWCVEYWRRRVVADAANQIAAELRGGKTSGDEAWRRFKDICERTAA